MKNLSILMNIVLLVAVGVLYYLHFNEGKATSTKTKTVAQISSASDANVNPNASRASIAYVELDSLNERITYIKSKRKELEGEQQAIETEWENGYKNLENQKNTFLKRGAAITQQEAENFQNVLLQQQQQIDGKKQNLTQKLSEKSYRFMDDIQKKLKDFLIEYNSQKNYTYIFTTGTGLDYMVYKDSSLNITNDVIEGMNLKMKNAGNP